MAITELEFVRREEKRKISVISLLKVLDSIRYCNLEIRVNMPATATVHQVPILVRSGGQKL